MDYTKFVDTIHKYTIRNSTVLPNSLIKTFVDMACDNIYKKLRVAPLEFVYTYDALTEDSDRVQIPGDAASFIQIRKLDEDGEVDIVYNARSDVRSFYQTDMNTNTKYTFTREGNYLVFYPSLEIGDVIQVYYYRRLPSIYARYAVNEANYAAGILYEDATSAAALQAVVEAAELDSTVDEGPFVADPELQAEIIEEDGSGALAAGWYMGIIAPNWLRDENYSMVLYGTLEQAYIYLQDMEKAVAAGELFNTAIAELNDEDKRSKASGGVLQTHFSGEGLL